MLLESLLELSNSSRLVELERRERKEIITGDFEGNVTGYWEGIGNMGQGLVRYRDKTYNTKRIGITSLPRNSEVELSFAKGIYFSKHI
jgi:hypothetical protein